MCGVIVGLDNGYNWLCYISTILVLTSVIITRYLVQIDAAMLLLICNMDYFATMCVDELRNVFGSIPHIYGVST